MPPNPLHDISAWRSRAGVSGIPSVCSAHPLVIEAAMRATLPTSLPLLVEATCNQVNQDGGYTGMTPLDFRAFILKIAVTVGFPAQRVILGGDHLGPSPWRSLPASEAMMRAKMMISAFAAAGFTKLHLDCSMACADDPTKLPDEEIARRATELAAQAEASWPGGDEPKPVYVIGTEVPIPGGAMEEIEGLQPTSPAAAQETVGLHARAFAAAGLDAVFARVIGLVVQPGVEFGNRNVVDYESQAASGLSAALTNLPGLVFEAHSTDYQTRKALSALVRDGFAILKVGPGLTFVLREALYGLDEIAETLFPRQRSQTLRAVMEQLMCEQPGHWAAYYQGTAAERALQRHYSYSDRIRYYWSDPRAVASVASLFARLDSVELPEPLIGQYLGARYSAVRAGTLLPSARTLVLAAVEATMADYIAACTNEFTPQPATGLTTKVRNQWLS